MCPEVGEEPIRIACIGSSITKGTGLCDPATESYPAQLAAFLFANSYPAVDVRNFGEGGAGVLRRCCNPYWDTDQYGDALAFDPHIVLILLGTNDSRERFWGNDEDTALLHAKEDICHSFAEEEERAAIVHGELEFERDLQELVEIFGMMPAEGKIFLCTPAPLFNSSGWLSQDLLRTEIVPRIRGVASKRGLRLVELFESSLAQRPDLFPDGLHPSADGARVIASLIGQVLLEDLKENGEGEDIDRFNGSAVAVIEETSRADHEEPAVRQDAVATEEQRMEEERQIVMRELSKMGQQSYLK